MFVPLFLSTTPFVLSGVGRLFKLRCKAQGQDWRKCRMILPILYVDGFEQHRSRKASVEGIYMALANMSKEELLSKESRTLLCEVPPGCDLKEAINIVVVDAMRLLERGINVDFNGETVRCFGSLFCVIGDHPSQAKLAGNNPLSLFTLLTQHAQCSCLSLVCHEHYTGLSGGGISGCRFCFKTRDLYSITKWRENDRPPPPAPHARDTERPPQRYPTGVCAAHKKALHDLSSTGDARTKAKHELKCRGWSTKLVSPFWALKWMRPSFFQCFAICLLHLEYLGLIKVCQTVHLP
jgi:hypothetical protein